jgi:predicted transcriptional regulator
MKQMSVRIDENTRSKLDEMARLSDRTASQFIRYLINREYSSFQDDLYRRGLVAVPSASVTAEAHP